VIADMKLAADMEKMEKVAIEKFGRIDIIVQNAGIYPTSLLRDMTEQEWDDVCDTNLKGSFLAVKACLPVMEKQAYGRIVMMSSITGPKVTQPGFAHYAASKGGVNGFIKTAALELARSGITVNGIEPGNIVTEGLDNRPANIVAALKQAIPMNEFGTVQDVAYTALFLASDEARYITGETIVVDGGQVLPCQHFGGRHQCRLRAAFHRIQHRQDRNDRLESITGRAVHDRRRNSRPVGFRGEVEDRFRQSRTSAKGRQQARRVPGS